MSTNYMDIDAIDAGNPFTEYEYEKFKKKKIKEEKDLKKKEAISQKRKEVKLEEGDLKKIKELQTLAKMIIKTKDDDEDTVIDVDKTKPYYVNNVKEWISEVSNVSSCDLHNFMKGIKLLSKAEKASASKTQIIMGNIPSKFNPDTDTVLKISRKTRGYDNQLRVELQIYKHVISKLVLYTPHLVLYLGTERGKCRRGSYKFFTFS
jgi:hypothetical protein